MSKKMWDRMIDAMIGRGREYKPPGFQPSHGKFPGVDIDAAHKGCPPTKGVWLTSGFYRIDELRSYVKILEGK